MHPPLGDAGPGETARLRRDVPHRWWNEGTEELEFDGMTRPAVDHDRYLLAVLVMPPRLQAMVFRVVVLVGTMLGRYRGTDWPGCPSRCLGAPQPEPRLHGPADYLAP